MSWACQLASCLPLYAIALESGYRRIQDLVSCLERAGVTDEKKLVKLFETLISVPLASALPFDTQLPVLLVLDALDEIAVAERRILLLLLRTQLLDLASHVKVLVSSRSERDICRAFYAKFVDFGPTSTIGTPIYAPAIRGYELTETNCRQDVVFFCQTRVADVLFATSSRAPVLKCPI